MKSTTKFIILLASILVIGVGNAKAQNPTFTVNWSGCHIQINDSYYKITYAIIDISLGAPVVGPNIITNIDQSLSSYFIEIPNWDCNQSIETEDYFILVQVELIKDNGYCSGDARSSTLTCAELYDNITINVPMDY